MKLLILSCPRSGTKFTAGFLQRCGLDFKHENIGSNGGIGWMFAGDTEFESNERTWPKVDYADFDLILHQVRNPLDVVMSMPTEQHAFWPYVETYIGPLSRNELKRRLEVWLRWNLRCAELSNFTFQVENLPHRVNGFNLKPDTNTRRGKLPYLARPTWWQVKEVLPAAFSLARRYGYGKDQTT